MLAVVTRTRGDVDPAKAGVEVVMAIAGTARAEPARTARREGPVGV
jgi:hypothetical protein